MKLTISMITLNEERAVAKVVGDIRRVVPDAEIFLVDSSKDRTAEIATELGCRVFKQFPPKGYGPAMDRAVRDAAGDIVITLDCDDTYPVEEIPHMVSLVEQGWDLVNATRLAKRPKAMPFANYLANRLFATRQALKLGGPPARALGGAVSRTVDQLRHLPPRARVIVGRPRQRQEAMRQAEHPGHEARRCLHPR